MKALTKPEKFRVMSRIYGYECDDWVDEDCTPPDPPSGTTWVITNCDVVFDENGDPEVVCDEDCESVDEDVNDC